MLFLQTLSTFCLAAFALADPAPVSRDSPRGVLYLAKFTSPTFNGDVAFFALGGFVFGFTDLKGLPRTGGPFEYRIHQRPVAVRADCRTTLGVFDPYDGVPHAKTQAEFRVGDISGKHGAITGRSKFDVYLDPYMSLNPTNPAFIGRLSVGIRSAGFARLACTNIRRTNFEDIPKEAVDKAQKILDGMDKNDGVDAADHKL